MAQLMIYMLYVGYVSLVADAYVAGLPEAVVRLVLKTS